MGEVTVTINDRSFTLGCDDGEEQHVQILAEHINKHVANLRHTLGPVGDDKLFLMAGLMVCDELWEARELLLRTREMLRQQQAAGEATKPENKTTETAEGKKQPESPAPQSPAPRSPVPEPSPAKAPITEEAPAATASERDLFSGSGI